MGSTPIFEWANVTIEADEKTIVSNFSLSLDEGEKVLLYGPSGTGKSSIVKAVLGFMPITEGEIRYRGTPLTKKSFWEIRKEIAYIPQSTDLGDGTVSDIIDSIFSYKANGDVPTRDKIIAVMERFDLPETFYEKEFQTLSGGEKQRIAIIVACLLDRPSFFLDEVTASLDSDLKSRIIKTFLDMKESTQCIISHDPDWISSGKLRVVDVSETMGAVL